MPFPAVIESNKDGEKAYDVFTRMLKDRIVFFTGVVEEDMANHIVAQLLFLESQDSKSPITMYVNSPGGLVTAGMAVYDTMNYISAPVNTVVIGQACSMGSLIASSGTGKRYMTNNARHMIHQPLGGASGQATDVEIQAKELLRWKKTLTDIYVKNTGKEFAILAADMERDNFMVAEDAVSYGLADEVVIKR